jgi:MFS-type transporter involved in bile tolerance (Atg22 family)
MAGGLFFLVAGAGWNWGLANFIGDFLWFHCGKAVTAGSMQVLSSDMATANARRRFFGFWRLIGEIGDLVSPALLGFLADLAAYAAARSMTVFFALATKVFLTVSGKETAGRETV